jgi:hypothetical protein
LCLKSQRKEMEPEPVELGGDLPRLAGDSHIGPVDVNEHIKGCWAVLFSMPGVVAGGAVVDAAGALSCAGGHSAGGAGGGPPRPRRSQPSGHAHAFGP